jgi:hypothetical protein
VRRHREYGGSLRRARCQANGLAYASTMGSMRVEPQQRNAHPTEDQSGSMNLPTSVAESVKEPPPKSFMQAHSVSQLLSMRNVMR